MDLLRFSTAGSVDDGKSTLIGRLLYDSKAIFEDQLQAVEQASAARGDATVDLALLTDGLRAEREQGITIDVAYRYTATPRRKFIIADTPGHIQYTRNMVTGASTAELAIILVDARKGVLTQSKRHSFIASLLQIPHIVVAVNKMDLVGYSEARFQEIVADYRAFAAKLNVRGVVYIPISALHGDNIVSQSANMPWYNGATLLHHLETVNIGAGRNIVDFRLPIQYVIRASNADGRDFRGFAGQIVSGRIALGEEVVALPTGIRSRVAGILRGDESYEQAQVGDSIVVTLEDEIDVSRGDMLVRVRNLPHSSNQIDATLCWMSEGPMNRRGNGPGGSFAAHFTPGNWYWLQHSTRRVRASVQELNYRIDVDTMHRQEAQTLQLNEIGRAHIVTTEPLFFDSYQINRATGSFILIDPHTNNTVAAGMIRDRARRVSELVQTRERSRSRPDFAGPRSSDVVWEPVAVTRPMREEMNGHGAAVLWFYGAVRFGQVDDRQGTGAAALPAGSAHLFPRRGQRAAWPQQRSGLQCGGSVRRTSAAWLRWRSWRTSMATSCCAPLFHPTSPIAMRRGRLWRSLTQCEVGRKLSRRGRWLDRQACSGRSTSSATLRSASSAIQRGCTRAPRAAKSRTLPAFRRPTRRRPGRTSSWRPTGTRWTRLRSRFWKSWRGREL